MDYSRESEEERFERYVNGMTREARALVRAVGQASERSGGLVYWGTLQEELKAIAAPEKTWKTKTELKHLERGALIDASDVPGPQGWRLGSEGKRVFALLKQRDGVERAPSVRLDAHTRSRPSALTLRVA